ncbi:uncharacterized protein LAESUDRAFT_173934 [Laetiporus sulphureus 93-53]|uniref:Uncharacterized protein n=1 Tax=Laetiporus sulphureus 93-53 TaxID=1314785 RepID=A0A165HWS0_9APHY|nr:uncharacterized protein LAESUDRAFT_173934 [Laetiporus sulphureus 93-53]KZT12291.1 hypothetical protein LAESUDRAFT_173934 [Laetiporus sulphureus 93-53]
MTWNRSGCFTRTRAVLVVFKSLPTHPLLKHVNRDVQVSRCASETRTPTTVVPSLLSATFHVYIFVSFIDASLFFEYYILAC